MALEGWPGEALIVTNKRVYVIKAGSASGAMFGQKCKAFPFNQITSVEISCGLTNGRIQLTTAGTIEQARTGSILDDINAASRAENVVTFGSFQKAAFEAAANIIRDAVERVQSQTQNTVAPQLDVADQIRKLADLVRDGILTQEEFEAKKKQLLGL